MKYEALTDGWRFDRAMKPQPTLSLDEQSRVLGEFSQVFPFSLFPDKLIIEELRVIWIKRMLPWASAIITIMATDIACVNASRGPFFGHVDIKSVTGGPEILVDSLWGRDAYKVRNLVEGIAMTSREGLKIQHQDNLEAERQELLRAGQIKSSLV